MEQIDSKKLNENETTSNDKVITQNNKRKDNTIIISNNIKKVRKSGNASSSNTAQPRKKKSIHSHSPHIDLLKNKESNNNNNSNNNTLKRINSDSSSIATPSNTAFKNISVDPTIFKQGELHENLKHMMYGFGDESEPLEETLNLMESYVVDHIQDVTTKALELSNVKGKFDTECFIFLIRKDPEIYEKIKNLLIAYDEIREASNSGFDPSNDRLYT